MAGVKGMFSNMWSNFKAMPFFMKLLALHGSIFLVGALVTLFPIGGFSVDGKEVTYADWWSSGAGIEFFLVALSIGTGAICLLKRVKYARVIYFAVLTSIFAMRLASEPTLLFRLDWVLTLIAFLGLIYWYLFHKKTVRRYFGASSL
ncbi:hypothetical protein [Marinobacter sp. CHS3-4]|uniref:hypothetical protein n=1 Tax=Marinobacter sp. CHS3-4 TaxID=3045174 RepID=UPI0024B56C1D|nr:hypothetical protein [Marinobacter sp. CHS3-4]MDI9243845.1 hypothetical protein [Marinobacter sp. CHS3-4]